MTLKELRHFFQTQLEQIYTESQTLELFQIMALELLGLNRIDLRTSMDLKLSKDDENRFRIVTADLQAGKPFQQILGKTEFYHLELLVNEHVLIPRPETEELVELAIAALKKANRTDFSMVDIGTGSGAIPIVIKKHFPNAELHALDISPKALDLAKKNALRQDSPIRFHLLDILQEPLSERYDVIISNPPYIGQDEQQEINRSVKDFEPTLALFSPTNDPLLFYKRIATLLESHLNPGGYLFLEINQKLGQETLDLYSNLLSEVALVKDLSGNDRFIIGRKTT